MRAADTKNSAFSVPGTTHSVRGMYFPQLLELKKNFPSRMLEDPSKRFPASAKTMDRPAKIVCFSMCALWLVSAAGFAQPGAAANTSAPRVESIIFKHVDENGRVTYANSPIKGGARVELEPLTVIPSTPSGSLNPANAQIVSRVAAPARAPVTAPVAASVKPGVQMASVFPLSSQAQAAITKTITLAPSNTVVASLESINQLTEQRRAETRRRLLEGELQTEEQLLVAARSKLGEEQKASNDVRAMRASFVATSGAVTAQMPLVDPEKRAEIERHFERVRNLQDQVAMHENHLQSLRAQLNTLK